MLSFLASIPIQLYYTLSILVVTLLLKHLWVLAIKHRQDKLEDEHKSWINFAKNICNFALVLGVSIVWLSEIQNFAISVAAFMVAIVIATKELLQCFLGFFTWAANRSFRVGDWIKIGDWSGEVADINWIRIRLLEIDLDSGYGYTGRSLTIMNSTLLSNTVVNYNFMRRYVMHKFAIYRDNSINLFELRAPMIERINELIEPFHEVAARYSSLISKRLDTDVTSPEPFIDIYTNNLTHQVFAVTLFCPTEEAHKLEQEITQYFTELWFQALDSKEALIQARKS